METELEQLVEQIGFEDFRVTWKKDIYAGAPQDSSAAAYGTLGITFFAKKPVKD